MGWKRRLVVNVLCGVTLAGPAWFLGAPAWAHAGIIAIVYAVFVARDRIEIAIRKGEK